MASNSPVPPLTAADYLKAHIELMERAGDEEWNKSDRALRAAYEWVGGTHIGKFSREHHIMLEKAALVILAAFDVEDPTQ